jgi:iron-sulfur cluster repair protein YtfE (RIC family)
VNERFDPFTQLERSHMRLGERLDELVQASAAPFSPTTLDVARDVAGFCARAVLRHEEDEESSLFPRLRERPELAPLLDKLAREHREHEALHARLDDAISALAAEPNAEAMKELADVADALVRAYRAHIEEEERVLFPAARAALDAASIAAISGEMEGRRGGERSERGKRGGGGGGGGRRR